MNIAQADTSVATPNTPVDLSKAAAQIKSLEDQLPALRKNRDDLASRRAKVRGELALASEQAELLRDQKAIAALQAELFGTDDKSKKDALDARYNQAVAALQDVNQELAQLRELLKPKFVLPPRPEPTTVQRIYAKLRAAKTLIDNAVNPPKPSFEQQLGRDIEKEIGPIISAADVKAVRALDAELRELWQMVNVEYTEEASQKEWWKWIQRGDARADDLQGRDSILSEFAARQEAARLKMRALQNEGVPMVRKARVNFVKKLEAWLERRAEFEHADADKFGMDWQPSAIFLEAKKIFERTERQLKSDQQPAYPLSDRLGFFTFQK